MTRMSVCSGEGLVIKHPLSLYQLGGREHSWIKIKPGASSPSLSSVLPLPSTRTDPRRLTEYMDQMGERIDGLVVGGYWGQGHRSGFLASYLIGLRDEVNGKVVCVLPISSRRGRARART